MIKVLNLNHRELIAERSALIEDLDAALQESVSLYELIRVFCDVSPTGARVSFANVAIQYLRNQGSYAQQA